MSLTQQLEFGDFVPVFRSRHKIYESVLTEKLISEDSNLSGG